MKHRPEPPRRGVVIVLSAILMIVMFAMAALAIDMGYMFVVRTQLQAAADAGALAAGNSMHRTASQIITIGKDYVARHTAGGRPIRRSEATVELGVWDADAETFTAVAGSSLGNAVRVTARRTDESLFFARVMGRQQFTTEASAISMANPKDIVFVIDASGSMNDDTEPAWATPTVNAAFAGAGFGSVGNQLMDDVYTDFGYGPFPGVVEHLGQPLGVATGGMAYGDMTSDVGPLTSLSIPARHRIAPGDDEHTRRQKCYGWIIENQLARLMPAARPRPTLANYAFWEKYIDYVLLGSYVVAPQPPPPPAPPAPPSPPPGPTPPPTPPGPPSPPPSPPPPPPPTPPIGFLPRGGALPHWSETPMGALAILGAARPELHAFVQHTFTGQVYGAAATGPGLPRVGGLYGRYSAFLPPNQDWDRIDRFNNPNRAAFPGADGNLPRNLRNYFGYLTYVQFLMDHGRDLRPDDVNLAEISLDSGRAPLRTETVRGRSFRFPPREQPMHAARRAMIAAMDVVLDRNGMIPSLAHRDRVAIVSFDTTNSSVIRQDLTTDYVGAMRNATRLQSVGDKGTTTATETGLRLAQQMLRPTSAGGQAREDSTKVVVLLTDGMPNAYESGAGAIDAFAAANPSGEFYGGGYYWLDASLKKAIEMSSSKVDLYPVGVGLGTDYNFMDRMARQGGTAGASGQSPRGSGNPAEYEQRMIEIFEKIIKQPVAKLVM